MVDGVLDRRRGWLVRYDEAVQRLVDTCECIPTFGTVSQAMVVRTVDGRVRLVLDSDDQATLVRLNTELGGLGNWFVGPAIATHAGPQAMRRIAKQLLLSAQTWPAAWPSFARRADGTDIAIGSRWCAFQVLRGKDAFLVPNPSPPPWPMHHRTPRITAFYGFKGGVGRTTTLAVIAWLLARRGQRVVVVDLDLESPGLGHALEPEHRPVDGLLDYLLTWAIERRARPPVHDVSVHGARIGLVPAGPLDGLYVEKLARLDVLHHGSDGRGAVYEALLDLLGQLRRQGADHVLLDCRSGLHDLAGLALHDLAHVDVFVGRGDRQELDGMRPLLRGWRARRALADRRLLFLRAMRELPLSDERTLSQRRALYDVLCDELYDDPPPALSDEGVAHDPCPIGLQPEIANAAWLGAVDPTTLSHATFHGLLARLDALWAPEI